MMMGLEQFLEQNYNRLLTQQRLKQPKRSEFVKQSLQHALGKFSEIQSSYTVEQLESTVFSTYIREKIMLHIDGYLSLPIYILTPLEGEGKLPTVLALHGHGYGSKEIVGLAATGEQDTGETIHKHFAVKLVERGMKVIAPEIIGYGERVLDVDKQAGKQCSCYRLATHLLLSGRTVAGIRVAEALRAVDYIETLNDVDPKRIGIMGFSGGGLLAAYSAALDDRFKAAVLCGFTSTFKDSILRDEHCIDNYLPGILQTAELPEIIGLLAPRPLFIESGTEDKVFPITGVKLAIEQLEQIYKQHEAEAALQIDIFQGVHEINGRVAYDWLKEVLMR